MGNSFTPKIVIISGSFPNIMCGVGDYVERLTESLMSRKIDISLLTSRDHLVKRQGHVHTLINRWNILALPRILSFIRKENPDIVNLQIPTVKYKAVLSAVSFLPILLKLSSKPPRLIVTVHDYSISKRFLRIFFLPLFLFSDCIIVTNSQDEEGITKLFPFLRNRLQKVYAGPSVEIVDIPDAKKEVLYRKVFREKEDRFITTFGFIKKDRLIDAVIKVFSKLSAENAKLKLIVLGDTQRDTDTEYKKSLFELVKNLGLENKIYFLGFCRPDEASFYFSISDLSILLYERGASFRRGSLINYMARKIPIVTNINKDYGIDRELAESGMVLTVDSLSIDKIVEKAEFILNNKDFADRMKKKMEKADSIFNWQNAVDKVMDVYAGIRRC